MNRFIGRKRELDNLKWFLEKSSSSLIVIHGRHRIGKSRLIREFGEAMPVYSFSGLPPSKRATKQEQIDEFCRQMEQMFDMPRLQTDDWGTVFWQLGKLCTEGRVILVFDEISWIGSKCFMFPGQIKNAWDLYLSHNPQLILILCGSDSDWIEEKILRTTGFVGRISSVLHLRELSIIDAVKFWGSAQKKPSCAEILSLLAVTGGVPRYLEEIRPNLSVEENIHRLCFDIDGILHHDFDQIFSDLFSVNAPAYVSIAKFLSEEAQTIQNLSRLTEKSEPQIFKYLKKLVRAGFVTEDQTWNLKTMKSSKLRKYRLSDNYARFYLTYILPNKEFERSSDEIMGLQFENLVLDNVRYFLNQLNIEPQDIVRWDPFFQRPTQRQPGCQIDLLIQTRFRTVYICEIKFSTSAIDLEVALQAEKKQENISLPRGWSSRLALIHANGVTSEVLQSGVVDYCVDFSALFSRP